LWGEEGSGAGGGRLALINYQLLLVSLINSGNQSFCCVALASSLKTFKYTPPESGKQWNIHNILLGKTEFRWEIYLFWIILENICKFEQ